MAKEISLEKDGFHTYWRNGDPQMIDVDVYVGERSEGNEPVMEWSYGKVAGSSIIGNASVWLDQAILQAASEIEATA